MLELSVIVPTRNEAGNVAELLARLERALPDAAEVLIVDDSDDGTPARVRSAARRISQEVRLLHRHPGERDGGLAGAVVAGMREARGRWVCVMDGDLQHPPELIPALVARAHDEPIDAVLATRYAQQGNVGGLRGLRRRLSSGSTRLAKLLFPRTLRGVSDPMSGFFLIRRGAIDVGALRPRGYKILLELLVRCGPLRTVEVGFRFGERRAGRSKASLREGLRFLRLLAGLRATGQLTRFARFASVGLVGLGVNTAVLVAMTEVAHVYYLASAFVATELSILGNYALSERWVFRDRSGGAPSLPRLLGFLAAGNLAFGLGGPLLYLLVSVLGLPYLLGSVVSIGTLTLLRFVLSDDVIWRDGRKELPTAAAPRVAEH
jgi:dolichol-phosphate mannosyltransferase